MNTDERPTKRDAFMSFLKEGWVSVHLDARRPGVVVPDDFGDNPHLVLQYGRDMPIPIPDLDVSDDGIRATLSFSRIPCCTVVPWSAVYIVACTDGRGVLYYEDVPEEVSLMSPGPDGRSGALTGEVPISEDEENGEGPKRRPTLRSIPLEEAEAGAANSSTVPEVEPENPQEDSKPTSKRKRRPTLKLVK